MTHHSITNQMFSHNQARQFSILVLAGLLLMISACNEPAQPPITESTDTANQMAPATGIASVATSTDSEIGTPVPVSNLPGYIVFVSRGDLFIVKADCVRSSRGCDQEATQLLKPQSGLVVDTSGSLTVSPDGSKIAFVSRNDSNILARTLREIYILDVVVCMSLESGCSRNQLVRLTNTQTGVALDDFSPAWSPQGDKIIFNREYVDTISPPALYEVQPDGSQEQPLLGSFVQDATMLDSSWAPDGQRIVVALSIHNAPTYIAVVNVKDGMVTELARPQADLSSQDYRYPHWSPLGDRIIFETRLPAATVGYSVKVDGSAMTRLPINNARHSFTWSPDGTKIAYIGFDPLESNSTQGSIFVSNLDGSQQLRLIKQRPVDNVIWIPLKTETR